MIIYIDNMTITFNSDINFESEFNNVTLARINMDFNTTQFTELNQLFDKIGTGGDRRFILLPLDVQKKDLIHNIESRIRLLKKKDPNNHIINQLENMLNELFNDERFSL